MTEDAGTPTTPVAEPVEAQSSPGESAGFNFVAEDGRLNDGWRDNLSLEDDFKTDPSLLKFNDFNGMVKSLINAQRMVGADKVVIPHDEQDPAWADVWNRLGRPEDKDGYDFGELKDVDDNLVGQFREFAHNNGYSNKQAKAAMDFYQEITGKAMEGFETQREQRYQQAEQALHQEWGQAMEQELSIANSAVRTFDTEGVLKELGLDNDPRVAKLMNRIGHAMGEDTIKGREPLKDTPAGSIAKARELMTDPAYLDKKNPRHEDIVNQVQHYFANAQVA